MASWWQDLGGFFDDFFGYVRSMNQNPIPQGDPSIDWLMDWIKDGPPSPSWSASPDQIRQFEYMFSSMPGYGDWVRARDNLNFMADYLKNYNLTWALTQSPYPGMELNMYSNCLI